MRLVPARGDAIALFFLLKTDRARKNVSRSKSPAKKGLVDFLDRRTNRNRRQSTIVSALSTCSEN
jgi:hypothetical protein